MIAFFGGVGLLTYLLNRNGRKWGWCFLAALVLFIVGSIVLGIECGPFGCRFIEPVN
jgi:hypothetical protein